MNSDKYIDVLNNLCKLFIQDGQITEEIIEMLLDAGADVPMLKEIGFEDIDIQDYAYYESCMSGRTEEEVLADLGYTE